MKNPYHTPIPFWAKKKTRRSYKSPRKNAKKQAPTVNKQATPTSFHRNANMITIFSPPFLITTHQLNKIIHFPHNFGLFRWFDRCKRKKQRICFFAPGRNRFFRNSFFVSCISMLCRVILSITFFEFFWHYFSKMAIIILLAASIHQIKECL